MAVKPDWLRVKAPQWERVGNVKEVLRDLGLNTVCEEASCPNIGECFNQGTATFLIMGPACTRACPYCDIDFEKRTSNKETLKKRETEIIMKYVKLTVKDPSPWFKPGTQVYDYNSDYSSKKHITLEDWEKYDMSCLS